MSTTTSSGTDLDGRPGVDPSARPVAPAPRDRPVGRGAGPADVRRRFAVSAALTAPLLLLAWVPLLQFPHWPWVAVALALPVAGWGALPLHRAALARLREGTASLDTLASAAVLVAVGASVPALLAGVPGVGQAVPLVVLGGGATGRTYLEVAAAVTTAVLGARVLARAAGSGGDRPRPERRAPWAVLAALLLAVAAGGFWAGAGAGRPAAVAIALAVLVAACPVAFAVTGPAAELAAARAARWWGVTGATPEVLRSVRGATTVLLGAGALAGAARPEVGDRLRRLGLDPVLLTADPHGAADALAARFGVDVVVADLPPQEQVAAVRRLQHAGCVVAVVGGAGDAGVLGAADVGIALVPAAADVVLPVPDPGAAVDVLDLGRRTAAVARTSTGWALAVAAPGVALAAGGLLHPSAAVAVLALAAAAVAVRSLTGFHGAGHREVGTPVPGG